MQAYVEALDNVGNVDVSRSAADPTTGGYTWSITFLTDAYSAGKCSEGVTCPNPGDVPTLSTDITATLGTSSAVDTDEVLKGNVMGGTFQLGVPNTNEWTVALDYDASTSDVKTALEDLDYILTVDVSKQRVDIYGGYEWSITYTGLNGHSPRAAGNVPVLLVDTTGLTESAAGLCLTCLGSGVTLMTSNVLPTVTGSNELNGTYTIDLGTSLQGPQLVTFDEPDNRLPFILRTLSTVVNVAVVRTEYGVGWDATRAMGGAGGYRYAVTFLANSGTFSDGVVYTGATLPPGSGPRVPFQPIYAGTLLGTGARVLVSTHVHGSGALDGTFTVAASDNVATVVAYSSTGVNLAALVSALPTIGYVNVVRDYSLTALLPGVVSVRVGDSYVSTSQSLLGLLSPGDIIRVGGGPGTGNFNDLVGSNGDVALPGTVTATTGSTSVSTTANLRSQIYSGQVIRIRGAEYTVSSTGVAVTQVRLWSAQILAGGSYQLTIGGTTTDCIPLTADAATFTNAVNTAIGTGTFYVDYTSSGLVTDYLISFDGDAWLSTTIPAITVSNAFTGPCATGANGDETVTPTVLTSAGAAYEIVLSAAFVGATGGVLPAYLVAEVFVVAAQSYAHQTVSLVSGSGQFSLTFATHTTACLPWGIDARSMQVAVNQAWAASSPGAIVTMVTTQTGYKYTIFFTGIVSGGVTAVTAAASGSGGCAPYSGTVSVSLDYAGDAFVPFTATVLPLAVVGASTTSATYKGRGASGLSVYKVNGLRWNVEFATNLGDVPALAVSGSGVTGATDRALTVTDNFNRGVLPLSGVIDGLNQGVEYFVSVSSSRAGTGNTTSEWYAPPVAGTPTGPPSAPLAVSASPALFVSEVQTITLSATHRNAAQTISTQCTRIPEVWSIITSANTGSTMAGTFTISIGGATTGAIANDAPASAVASAVQAVAGAGTVLAIRSLMSDEGGYAWTLTFEGASVDMLPITCAGNAAFNAVAGAACLASQDSARNQLGGTFTVSFEGVTTVPISYNATDSDMQAALAHLFDDDASAVAVTRSVVGTRNDYVWTITFVESLGAVPFFTTTSSLTGAGAYITVGLVSTGNSLGGIFVVSYKGRSSAPVVFNAAASVLEAALRAMMPARVNVTISTTASYEGGYTYTVAFDEAGDLPLMTVDTTQLTGTGASATVREAVKGALASAASLAVSWSAPMTNGGFAVSGWAIDWDGSNSFMSTDKRSLLVNSADLLYAVQSVSAVAPTPISTAAGSTFVIGYGSYRTDPINAGATADDVRFALEALPDIITCAVVRDDSSVPVADTVRVNFGDAFVTTSTDLTSMFPSGSLIWVGGFKYRVNSNVASTASMLPLASALDATQVDTYAGDGSNNAALLQQGNGYIWTVTLLSVVGPLGPLYVPTQALSPATATISTSGVSCAACVYLPAGSVLKGRNYFVRVAAINPVATGPWSLVSQQVPEQLPGAPSNIVLAVVSNQELELTWGPPADAGGALVVSYLIQWDTSANFNTIAFDTPLGSYRYTRVVGYPPPYDYVISFQNLPSAMQPLVNGTTLFVRISAENSVPIQNTPVYSNRVWAAPLPAAATTAYKKPSAPKSVLVALLTPTALRITIDPATRNGGRTVTAFVVSYDARAAFDCIAACGSVTVPFPSSQIVLESNGGPLLYDLTGLTTGTSYYVRVQAVNSMGGSPWTVSSVATLVCGKPAVPTLVVASTVTSQPTPITAALVEWAAPTTTGGSAVDGYMVEWWTALAVTDVQTIRVASTYGLSDVTGSFIVKFGGYSSAELLTPDATAENVRYTLMTIIDSGGTPPIQNVLVTRTTTGATVVEWAITFVAAANQGDVPTLMLDSTLLGSAGSCGGSGTLACLTAVVLPVRTGARIDGNAETQLVTVTATGGWFRLSWPAGGSWTPLIAFNAPNTRVQDVLQELPQVGVVDVVRSVSGNVYTYTVTFLSNVGDLAPLQVDATLLTGSSPTAVVSDGNNALTPTSALVCPTCAIGETPLNYHSTTVAATVFSAPLNGLTPGVAYRIRVSAHNAHGYGTPAIALTPLGLSLLTPPEQVPGAPVGVTLAVHSGSSSEIDTLFSAPTSNGGAPVLQYRLEWDTTPAFTGSGGYADRKCPDFARHAVFAVSTTGTTVTGGSFTLSVSRGGFAATTQPIAWNAPAQMSDESLVAGSIFCTFPAAPCTTDAPGSMQSQLQYLSTVISSAGVQVVRTSGGGSGSYTWSITFMDDASDWLVTTVSSSLVGTGSPIAAAPVQLVAGELSATLVCTSPQTIFGLTQGIPYYVRVSAYNQIGFGASTASALPQKPIVVPGRPTTVSLIVASASQLRVSWSPPVDNGGDVVTKYLIEYALDSLFSVNLMSTIHAPLTYGDGSVDGGPYSRAITNLAMGTVYYVRVSAFNSQGYGLPQAPTPPFEHPCQPPSAPRSVQAAATAATLISIQWADPSSDGGDPVTSYRVSWDTDSAFQSLQHLPNKGTLVVDAAAAHAATITSLTPGTKYYVKVEAANRRKYGAPAQPVPAYVVPSSQKPGMPSMVTLSTSGVPAGSIQVNINNPIVPFSGVFCDGGGTGNPGVPAPCPAGTGRTGAADGGVKISSFSIQYSVHADFSTLYGTVALAITDASSAPFSTTISGLPAQLFHVRVAAYNANGISNFCSYTGILCDTTGTLLSTMPA